MYGKIFESIYDGTLREHWEALVTFQQMIVLADQDGVCDVTPRALSSRTGIPLHVIEAGIAVLESPDPGSRSPELEGRRIHRLDAHRDWGWQIVNHTKYQSTRNSAEIRENNAKRAKLYRERQKESASQPVTQRHAASRGVTARHAASRPKEEEEDEHEEENAKKEKTIARARFSYSDQFEKFWSAYPSVRKTDKRRAWDAWQKSIRSAEPESIIAAAVEYASSDRGRGEYSKQPATWLNGACWDDDRAAWRDDTAKKQTAPKFVPMKLSQINKPGGSQ